MLKQTKINDQITKLQHKFKYQFNIAKQDRKQYLLFSKLISALLLILSMSYYSPALEQLLANRQKTDETNSMIKKIRNNAPVLSTIIDYGGESTIDEILHLDEEDKNTKVYNNFQRILKQSNQGSNDNSSSRRFLSFIDYKAKPVQTMIDQQKKRSNSSTKKLKTSIVVQLPKQLKQMKNQILMLPSLGQSRLTASKPSIQGSRFLDEFKRVQSRRYQTEASETPSSCLRRKKQYLSSIRDILSSFESPQINCNGYILGMHKACKQILNEQQKLEKDYKRFQSLGSPPKRIIQLKKYLHEFERQMDQNLDNEVSQQISNMDSKRYDLVLKHEEQVRKMNMIKFQQKKKTERLEELKSAETEKSLKSDQLGFKLNSKGHLIYLNKNKSPK